MVHILIILLYFLPVEKGFALSFPLIFHEQCLNNTIGHLFQKCLSQIVNKYFLNPGESWVIMGKYYEGVYGL